MLVYSVPWQGRIDFNNILIVLTDSEMDRSAEHIPTKYLAIERLASLLFWEMEKLDHSGHFDMALGVEDNWLSMPESERSIYTVALGRKLLNRDFGHDSFRRAVARR
jgi:hypothetical protein